MFDLNSLKRRYFTIRFSNGLKIDVESPKLSTVRKLRDLHESDVEGVLPLLAGLLSKNKQRKAISAAFLDTLDLDDIRALLLEYMNWLQEVKTDPN